MEGESIECLWVLCWSMLLLVVDCYSSLDLGLLLWDLPVWKVLSSGSNWEYFRFDGVAGVRFFAVCSV